MYETTQAKALSKELKKCLIRHGVDFKKCTFKTEIIPEHFTYQLLLKLFKSGSYLGTYFSVSLEGGDISILDYHPRQKIFHKGETDDQIFNAKNIEQTANDIYIGWIENAEELTKLIIKNIKEYT